MWITEDVELPEELLSAHREGKLVFFVGAGASMAPPSSLPSFLDLVDILAGKAGVQFDKKENEENLDRYLGEMPERFDVHQQTKRVIADAASQPNLVHRAIIKLAGRTNKPKIVTTNFDMHLSEAAELEGVQIPNVWTAPALPYGGDFSGIVHLHGALSGRDKDLVLTDDDFGRAYLTRSWATRFLLPMFQEFSVLFIGYSHSDPLMRYLALGLPANTPRYSIGPDSEDIARWTRLGIRLITYTNAEGDHASLPKALEAWDESFTTTRTAHIKKMQILVTRGVVESVVDHDYLENRIESEEGVEDFVLATSQLDSLQLLEWLKWLEDKSVFRELFESFDPRPSSVKLAWWFGDTFIKNPDLNAVAIRCLGQFGFHVSEKLFWVISSCASQVRPRNKADSLRWKVLLATSLRSPGEFSASHLITSKISEDADHALLIRALLRPRIKISRWSDLSRKSPSSLPLIEIDWGIREGDLSSLLPDKPIQTGGNREIVRALENALDFAYRLTIQYYGNADHLGSVGTRSAIEPHAQDSFRGTLDAILDGLRDFGESIIKENSQLIWEWWNKGYPLFQRVAIHLLNNSSVEDPEFKVTWILEQQLLYSLDYRHEVFKLLADQISSISADLKHDLLHQVFQQVPSANDSADREYNEYQKYNLLYWLTTHDPAWHEAKTAFKQVQDDNQNFAPRDFPDLLSWSVVEDGERSLPLSAQEFASSLDRGDFSKLEELLRIDSSNAPLESHRWSNVLSLIKTTTRSDVGHGLIVFDKINHLEASASQITDVKTKIVEAWSDLDLIGVESAVIEKIQQLLAVENYHDVVANFILAQGKLGISSPAGVEMAVLRDLAQKLWEAGASSFEYGNDPALYSGAALYLNSWPGSLAQFWMLEIQLRWNFVGESWQGLDQAEESALLSMISGSRFIFNATFPAIAQHLAFLVVGAEEFTREHIIPKFENDETLAIAWGSFLYRANWNNRIISAGVLGIALTKWDDILNCIEDEVKPVFLDFIISVVSHSSLEESECFSLLDKAITSHEQRYASEFVKRIERMLTQQKTDVNRIWEKWLKKFLQQRMDGLPRSADPSELLAWADLVPFLGVHAEEAIDFLSGKQIGLGDDHHLYRISADTINNLGEKYASFLAKRIEATDFAMKTEYEKYALRRFVSDLHGNISEVLFEQILGVTIEKVGPLDLSSKA